MHVVGLIRIAATPLLRDGTWLWSGGQVRAYGEMPDESDAEYGVSAAHWRVALSNTIIATLLHS